jgi:hypothetical protein
MDDHTSLFFKPTQIFVQGRLEFLSVPPDRVVAFPCEVLDFTGITIHYRGDESVMCPGPERCSFDHTADIGRPYFYAPCYLCSSAGRNWKRFLLPIGMEVSTLGKLMLRGRAFKVQPRTNAKGRKKGLFFSQIDKLNGEDITVPHLEDFDIRQRILQRYNLA